MTNSRLLDSTSSAPPLKALLLVGFVSFGSVGCASGGKYELSTVPTVATTSFRSVEVSAVETETTTSELEPELVSVILRSEIVTAILEEETYQQVVAEVQDPEGAITVSCRIAEYDKGSQVGRFLLGLFGTGRAHLDVACSFADKENHRAVAAGVFTGWIKGGWFGGAANQWTMAKNVGKAIARFLKESR